MPWGCQRTSWDPHCGSESARVSSLSAWSFPLRGLPPFSRLFLSLEALSESLIHSIPRSFLVVALSASAVGFADTLWLCLERALRLFFSLVDPSHCRPSCAVSMLAVSVIGARIALTEGRLPMRLVPSEPLGVCGCSTYIDLHRTWLVSANLPFAMVLRSVFHILLRDILHVFMVIILSVSCSCVPLTRIP